MNCDAIAPWYRALEYAAFGRALERCRTHWLSEITGVRRALVIGDGDGRFLERLLAACPEATVDAIDCSAGMLALARARAGDARVRYLQLDALHDCLPAADYDLIATHFVLDCFNSAEQHAVAARLPKARWLISEFRRPKGIFSVPGGMFIALMYRFFAVATGLKTRSLADHRQAMVSAGYRLDRCQEHRFGLLVSEVWKPGRVE